MNFKSNHLLAILPENTYQRLLPHFNIVNLQQGKVLNFSSEIITKVYFPLSCLLSIIITMNDGNSVETAVVGNQELLGINAVIGTKATTQTEYIVQVSGAAVEISASLMYETFQQDCQFRTIILQYTQVFIAQISQTTGCNRLHILEQRLARWLLKAQDCLNTNEIPLTQEFLSQMLGVRRPAVTLTLQKFQHERCISYSRGAIIICDYEKLKSYSCECFEIVKQEYNRILGFSND